MSSTIGSDCRSISYPQVIILGEIVSATNLGAVRKDQRQKKNESSQPKQQKPELINSYCDVHWGESHIHRSRTIPKNNNPIWACDTGSLFKIKLDAEAIDKELKVEIYNRKSKKKHLIGEVRIPGHLLASGEICNEKRMQFEIDKEEKEETTSKSQKGIKGLLHQSVTLVNDLVLNYVDLDAEDDTVGSVSIDDDNSLYGGQADKTAATFASPIDDGYIFGRFGTIVLRFRVATTSDLQFLEVVDDYNKGYKKAKRKGKQALNGVKELIDGKILANAISETEKFYENAVDCQLLHEMIEYRVKGKILDEHGTKRLKVKPYADPNNPFESIYLSASELVQQCYEPSKRWVEAGSGSLGQVKLEILSAQGLPNKDIGQVFGNKTDPFCCIVYEDCLVETDMISDCLDPLWMPWTQRAFVFNRMHPLSSIYIGVFNHKVGLVKHTGCGRIAVDLRDFEPNTIYTLKYELFSSPVLTNRKSKGSITIRLQILDDTSKASSMQQIMKAPIIHLNVKRRKTLAIARYTCNGKCPEDVANMRVLRSYIDEFLEYMEISSFVLQRAMMSLIFWRGQMRFVGFNLPIHSFLAFISAIYVIERPQLIPSYVCFCMAWSMFALMQLRSKYPYPWQRGRSCVQSIRYFMPSSGRKVNGVNIEPGEGFEEMKKFEEDKKKIMEDDKMLQSKIANMRNELQEILAALTEVNLVSQEGNGLNPLSKLLPVQLILRDIMYYVRWVKFVLRCSDSAISSLVMIAFLFLSILLATIPVLKILHSCVRVAIWIFLGPWMKILDVTYRRNQNKRVKKHVRDMMRKIQQREQKKWIDARILREEALKLKATRILRFGRFSLRVPLVNITRFRDYPLPDSFAETVDGSSVTQEVQVQTVERFVPGQKHHGVMIPELDKPSSIRDLESEKKQAVLLHMKESYEKLRHSRNLKSSFSKDTVRLLKMKDSQQLNVIYEKDSGSFDIPIDIRLEKEGKLIEARERIDASLRSSTKTREDSPVEFDDLQVPDVLSDLTEH